MTHGHELRGGGMRVEGEYREEGNKGEEHGTTVNIINKIYLKNGCPIA